MIVPIFGGNTEQRAIGNRNRNSKLIVPIACVLGVYELNKSDAIRDAKTRVIGICIFYDTSAIVPPSSATDKWECFSSLY